MIPASMSRGLPRLRFDSPEDEHQFDKGSQASRLRYFLISGWVSLLIFNGFLVVDWLVSPDVFALGVLVRLMIFTSFGIATMLMAWLYRPVVLALPSGFAEGMVVMTGVLAALSVAVVLSSPAMRDSHWAVHYHGGFVPVIMYGTVVQRLRFRHAAIFAGIVLLIHWACMATGPREADAPVVPMLLFVVSVAMYTLIINFRLEYEERQQFLRHQRGKVLLAQLDHSRIELEKASRCDPLTGVANRRAFDHAMQDAWANAVAQGTPLSLLLVDVDHFKAYNDHYGHPAGDACLVQVADAVQRCLRRPGDLVARYGGEEFIAVLNRAPLAQALAAAERVREAIEALDLPHEAPITYGRVTASIGVATLLPAECQTSAERLIALADEALYQAKNRGRNRVWPAPAPTAPSSDPPLSNESAAPC